MPDYGKMAKGVYTRGGSSVIEGLRKKKKSPRRRYHEAWRDMNIMSPEEMGRGTESWDPAKWSEQARAGVDEYGFPITLPSAETAGEMQMIADRQTMIRNDQLMREALGKGDILYGAGQGALQSGLMNLQTYRPGGAAALTSPYYTGMANLYASQADFGLRGAAARRTESPDLMFRYRDAARKDAADAAKRSGLVQLVAGVGGAVIGGAMGGPAGAMVGGGIGGQIGQQAGPNVPGVPQSLQGPGVTPLTPPGGGEGVSGTGGAPTGGEGGATGATPGGGFLQGATGDMLRGAPPAGGAGAPPEGGAAGAPPGGPQPARGAEGAGEAAGAPPMLWNAPMGSGQDAVIGASVDMGVPPEVLQSSLWGNEHPPDQPTHTDFFLNRLDQIMASDVSVAIRDDMQREVA
jgi:hypothetical protein